MLNLLRRVAVDVSPVRESREFRLLELGQAISGLGTQAVLVALPFQIFVTSRSAALVGLLGAFELGPMIVVSQVGGALADRHERRAVLGAAQVGVIVVAGALAAVTLLSHRVPVLLLLLLGGLLAGVATLTNVIRSTLVPGILGPERVRSGIALNYGLMQATAIVGPGLGGLLIGALGVGVTYVLEVAGAAAMLLVSLRLSPQRPQGVVEHPPVLRAIGEGVRYVARNRALAGSFVIDLNAMAFGMPRALFAVLSLTVYHAGAGGTGLLYAAIAVGGTLAVLTSGWVAHSSRLGRIVIAAVVLWGLTIVGAGLVRAVWPAAALLAAAGWADGISAVCRSTISQTVTPDRMRGRLNALYILVVNSGPRLGDIESGLVAGLVGALNSVLIGGIGCIVGVGAVVLAFPELAAYDAETAMRESGMLDPAVAAVEPVTGGAS